MGGCPSLLCAPCGSLPPGGAVLFHVAEAWGIPDEGGVHGELAGFMSLSKADLSHYEGSTRNGVYYRSQTAQLVASTPPAVLRSRLSPFLPRRVLAALAAARASGEGGVDAKGDSGSSVRGGEESVPPLDGAQDWRCPDPTALQAAVLLVDVSGFTRLSEAYSAMGAAGCEEFSLLIGELFEKLTVVIEYFGGDIDCFAGDAVLVVFPAQVEMAFASAQGDDGMRAATAAATLQALRCADVIESRLSGFQKSPADPPLTVHSALAVGTIRSVICGGRRAPRSEAFIIGEPLRELGVALSQSHTSELVAAPSVTRALGELPGEQRDGGCTCLTFPLHVPDLWTADIPFPEVIQLGSAGGSLRGFKRRGPPKRTKATTVKDLRERLLRRSGADDEYHKSARTTANPPVARLARGDDTDAMVSYDLEELLRFMPEFVKHRMFATRGTRLFAEHRYVSVLFVIGTMKEGYSLSHEDGSPSKWLRELQTQLGVAIDVAEDMYGATTRQITVDDKGVAAIFVFGLPGSSYVEHTHRCALTAHRVLAALRCTAFSYTAGVTTGQAFCGLIGQPARRCEYTVMGDVVNTAARLAGYAAKKGIKVACLSSSGADVLGDRSCSRSQRNLNGQLDLQPAGTVKLKGKLEESDVSEVQLLDEQPESPEGTNRSRRYYNPDARKQLHGREGEMAALVDFAQRGGSALEPSLGLGSIMLVKGDSGIGKSALLGRISSALGSEGSDASGSQVQPLVVRVQVVANEKQPLHAAHAILKALLEELGEPLWGLSSRLEDLNLRKTPVKSLPAAVAEAAGDIAALDKLRQPAARLEGFTQLYTRVIRTLCARRPMVLLLDDAHLVDSSSIRVLKCILVPTATWESSQQIPPGSNRLSKLGKRLSATVSRSLRASGSSHMPTLICTLSTAGGLDATVENESTTAFFNPSIQAELEDLALTTGNNVMTLGPLPDDAVLRIAQSALSTTSPLSRQLRTLILSFSQGIPLYVYELSRWLRNRVKIEGDGTVALTAGVNSGTIVPPSVHSLVQSHIDAIPAALQQLLRCASVIGVGFEEPLLLKVVQLETDTTEAAVHRHLCHLGELHLLNQTPDGNWQFQRAMHQQVVYQSLLYKQRRRLHRAIIEELSTQIDSLEEDMPPAAGATADLSLRERLASQWLHLLSSDSMGTSIGNVSPTHGELPVPLDDILRGVAAIKDTVRHMQGLGLHLQALHYQDRMVRMLNMLTVSMPELTRVMLEAMQDAMQQVAMMTLHGRMSKAEAAKWLTELQGLYEGSCWAGPAKLSFNRRTESIRSQGLGSCASMQCSNPEIDLEKPSDALLSSRILEINIWAAPHIAEWGFNNFLLDEDVREELAGMFREALSTDRILCAAYLLFANATTMDFASVRRLAQTAYQMYLMEGRPAELPFLPGYRVIAAIAAFLPGMDALCGDVNAPGCAGLLERELAELEAAGQGASAGLLVCVASVLESMWETPTSPRLRALTARCTSRGLADSGCDEFVGVLPGCAWIDALHKVCVHAEAVETFLSASSPATQMEEDAAARHATMLEGELSLLLQSATRLPLCIWSLVRLCVAQGRAIVSPLGANGGAKERCPRRQRVAAVHLATVTTTLARCLEWWEERHLGRHDASCLPATLLWAHAMLHWFQCIGYQAGLRLWLHTAPWLLLNFDGWRAAVVRALLLAQATATGALGPKGSKPDAQELMTAGLHATTDLARLLLTPPSQPALVHVHRQSHEEPDSCAPLPHGAAAAETAMVPLDAQLEWDFAGSLRVSRVSFGSPQAAAIAKSHLRQLLAKITVAGCPVSVDAAAGLSSVANSATVWEAVQLCRDAAARAADRL